MKKNKGTLRPLLEYAGRRKALTYLSLVLSGVSAVLALAPFVWIWLIARDVIAAYPDFSAAHNIAFYGWMAVLFAALSILIYIGGLMCSHMAAFRVATNIRKRLLRHVVKLPYGAFDAYGSGRARKVINESSAATETYLAHNLPDLVGAVTTPLCMIALMFVFDWRLGLASLFPVLCAFVVMRAMTGKNMQERMRQYNDALMDMNNEAVEYVRGVPVVKTFGQTVYSFARFKKSIDNYHTWVVAYTKSLRQPMMFFTMLTDSVFAFITVLSLIIAGAGGADGQFTVNLIFYVIFTPIIAVTLNRIMFMSENGMIVRDAMARIDGILEMQPLPEGGTALPQGNGVSFRHVTFRYPGGGRDALHDVSFEAPAGGTLALVGPSGGGKSTAAALIARLLDVSGGAIEIGGANIKNIPKQALNDTVAYVFQDNRLLKATIAENVRLARPDASDEEVMRALQAAQCGDIIAKMPQGIHTTIGGEGHYLSGGECQRVAIARAILKDAPVIVLDEATAFADPENEYLVQRAFERLTRGKTVIMIAHRLSTVTGADRICVLDGGELKECGTHGQLLEQGGLYARMWSEYTQSVKWGVKGAADGAGEDGV